MVQVTVGNPGGVEVSVPGSTANTVVRTTGNLQINVGSSTAIRSVPKQETTRPVVAQGEKKPIIVPDSVVLGVDTIGPYIRRIDGGPGILVFPEDNIEDANVVISHANTTSAVSTNNEIGLFISNINIDQFGHITSFEANNTIAFASNLETARDITLTGVISGNTSFDGSQNVIIDTSSLDFTLGSTSLTLGESTSEIVGLTNLQVGQLTLSTNTIISDNEIILQANGNVNSSNSRIVNLSDPIDNQDAATKIYVDNELDLLEADLLDVSDPVNPNDAANKQYVDDTARNLNLSTRALAATTTDLGSYANNTITLPNTPSINIDNVTSWAIGDLLLVKDQNNSQQNGIYTLIQTGPGQEWIFERSDYNDETDEIPGSFVFVVDGTENRDTSWFASVSDAETFALGSDAIIFKQFSGEGTFTAGDGLSIIGTDFSVNVDDSTIEIVGDTLQVANNGITNAKLENDSIILGTTSVPLGLSTTELRNLTLLSINEIEGLNNRLTLDSIIVDVDSTGGLIIPVGSSIQRPPPEQGMIRYNTTDQRFEAYNGVAWTGLGGVVDVDQDTYVEAESSPGADNDQLDFYTAGSQRLRLNSDGALQYGDGLNKFTIDFATGDTNIAGNLDVVGDITLGGSIRIGDQDVDTIEVIADFTSNLIPDQDATFNLGSLNKNWNRLYIQTIDSNTEIVNFDMSGAIVVPIGGSTERPSAQTGMIRFNTDDERFEAYNGTFWSGLSGSVIDIDQDTKIIAETSPNADNDQLDFFTAGIQRLQLDANGALRYGDGLNKFVINFTTGRVDVDGEIVVDDITLDGNEITSTANLVIDPVGDIDVSNNLIRNLVDPIELQDAVTKNYLENTYAREFEVIDGANTFVMDLVEDGNPTQLNFGPSLKVQRTANNQVQIDLTNTGIDANTYGQQGFIPQITVDSEGRIISALDFPLELSANTVVDFSEFTQDVVSEMVRFNVEEGISVTYDDPSGKLNFRTNNFILDFVGDVVGANTVIRNGNTSFDMTIATDYISDITANSGIEITVTPGSNGPGIGDVIDIRHANTSNITDVLNGPGVVINDITFDEFGHVQSVVSEDLNVNFVNVNGDTMTGPLTVPSIIDANNANYYLDPDQSSVLNDVDITNLISANAEITDLTITNNLIAPSLIDANDNNFFVDPSGNTVLQNLSISGGFTVPGDLIASRYVDADNTNFYMDPASESRVNNITFGYGGVFSYATFVDNPGASTLLVAFQGKFGTYNSGSQFLWYADRAAGSFNIASRLNAPNLYDSQDSQYFIIPRLTTSKLNGLNLDSNLIFNDSSSQIVINNNLTITQNSLSTPATEIILNPGNGLITVSNSRIENVTDPINNQDAATKKYVDDTVSGGITGLIGGEGLTYDANTFTFDVNVDGTTIQVTNDILELVNPFVNIAAESGNIDILNLGETITFAAGEGINTTVSNNQILIAGEIANTTNIGVASFNASNFAVAAGDVTVIELDGGTF